MQVPPKVDEARNYAAKAQFYHDFVAELDREIERA
jgi:hypothetical protein